jgi:hypothetical protein
MKFVLRSEAIGRRLWLVGEKQLRWELLWRLGFLPQSHRSGSIKSNLANALRNGNPRPVLGLEDAMTESFLVHSDFDLLRRLWCRSRSGWNLKVA